MESDSDSVQNPSDGGRRPTTNKDEEEEVKPKVVVIMGPTGSGKSKLAIDLAARFPIEIINADSMQVYYGLDVLTNKVPLHEQKGVPHHLLGTVSPNVEFTAKDFRDSAIPIINEILSRNCLPVIVGGTNYYIQALVSPFLLDDMTENLDESYLNRHPGDEQTDLVPDSGSSDFNSYDYLKELDPVAANRVHPHDHRKYVEQRVDSMIDAGLLGEVYDIYNPHADYTRGLRQAIGVREFEDFLSVYLWESRNDKASDSDHESVFMVSVDKDKILKDNMREILYSSVDNELKVLLTEAIDKVKLNTRRLVRRQKRRLTRLQTLFGWNIQHVDATESISCKLDEAWAAQVVGRAVEIISSFLNGDLCSVPYLRVCDSVGKKPIERNLWTQFVCKACGDRVLRGAHEWEQHKQGRSHRKRISRIRKSEQQCLSSAKPSVHASGEAIIENIT